MDKMRPGTGSSYQWVNSRSTNWLDSWQAWDLPGCAPGLGKKRIHLWMLDRGKLSVGAVSQIEPVSPLERKRAAAYKFQKDRDRYLIARAGLRQLLSGYLQVQPAEVKLTQGRQGKPRLEDPNPANLYFNLSHAGCFTLIAFSQQAAVGVDLEAATPKPEQVDLASQILSPLEKSAFDKLPDPIKAERFYLLWTMKEAVLKALGTGFRQDPRKLELGVALAPVEVRAISLNDRHCGTWTLVQLPVKPGYLAAVAIQGVGWSLDCWRLEGTLQR